MFNRNQQTAYGENSRRKRRKEHETLKNVISLRITDEELTALTRQSREESKTISELIRDALKFSGPCGNLKA